MTPQHAFTPHRTPGCIPDGYYQMELDRDGYIFTVWIMAYKVELAQTNQPDDGDDTDISSTSWREDTNEFIRLTGPEYDRAHDVAVAGYRAQIQERKDWIANQELEESIERDRE